MAISHDYLRDDVEVLEGKLTLLEARLDAKHQTRQKDPPTIEVELSYLRDLLVALRRVEDKAKPEGPNFLVPVADFIDLMKTFRPFTGR